MGKDGKPGRLRVKLIPVFVVDGERVYPDRRILSMKELLRPDEVADILRISRSQVYYLCYVGELEFVKIGGCVRIKSESVRRYIDERGEKG